MQPRTYQTKCLWHIAKYSSTVPGKGIIWNSEVTKIQKKEHGLDRWREGLGGWSGNEDPFVCVSY